MAVDEGTNVVLKHAVDMGRLVGTNLIDAAYLVLVAMISWAGDWAAGYLDLDGVDLLAQRCLQWIFGIVSVATIVIHMVRDLVVTIQRAVKGEL